MTAASSEESPRWAWFAHHQIQFVIGAIAVALLADLTDTDAISLLSSVLLVGFLIGQHAVRRHTGILCGRCLDNVPTDAAVQVKRRDWSLRLYHWELAHPLLVLVGVLAIIATDLVFGHGAISIYIVWPWFAVEAWSQRFHNRVAPWCPYCRGGGGGHHEHVPDPLPTGTKRST